MEAYSNLHADKKDLSHAIKSTVHNEPSCSQNKTGTGCMGLGSCKSAESAEWRSGTTTSFRGLQNLEQTCLATASSKLFSDVGTVTVQIIFVLRHKIFNFESDILI